MLNLAKYRVTDPEDSREVEKRIRTAHAAFLAELAENTRKRDLPGYVGYVWVGTPILRAEWGRIARTVRPLLSRRDRDREDRS